MRRFYLCFLLIPAVLLSASTVMNAEEKQTVLEVGTVAKFTLPPGRWYVSTQLGQAFGDRCVIPSHIPGQLGYFLHCYSMSSELLWTITEDIGVGHRVGSVLLAPSDNYATKRVSLADGSILWKNESFHFHGQREMPAFETEEGLVFLPGNRPFVVSKRTGKEIRESSQKIPPVRASFREGDHVWLLTNSGQARKYGDLELRKWDLRTLEEKLCVKLLGRQLIGKLECYNSYRILRSANAVVVLASNCACAYDISSGKVTSRRTNITLAENWQAVFDDYVVINGMERRQIKVPYDSEKEVEETDLFKGCGGRIADWGLFLYGEVVKRIRDNKLETWGKVGGSESVGGNYSAYGKQAVAFYPGFDDNQTVFFRELILKKELE